MTTKNIIRAAIISVLIALIYTVGTAMIYTQGPKLGTSETVEGVDAFLHYLNQPFYLTRMLESVIHQFVLVFSGCLILLWWMGARKRVDPDNPPWTEELLGPPVLQHGRKPQKTSTKEDRSCE